MVRPSPLQRRYYRIDVCSELPVSRIETLPPEDFFILDEWNACLTNGSPARYPLTPSGCGW